MRTVLFWLMLSGVCAAQPALRLASESALPSAPAELLIGPLGRQALVTCGVGTDKGRVLLLERASGKTVGSLDAPDLRTVSFFDFGQSIFVDTAQGFWLWHLGSGERRWVDAPNSAAGICPDGSVVVASHEGAFKAFDALGKLVDTMPGGASGYDRLEVGADGLNLALTNSTRFYLYDLPEKTSFSQGEGWVAFHPGGLSMARQSPSGWLVDFRLENGSRMANPVSDGGTGSGLEISPDGQLLLTSGSGGARVWSYPRLLGVAARPLAPGQRCVFGCDSHSVVSWSAAGPSELWDARTGATVGVVRGGSVIAASGGPGWVARLERTDGGFAYREYERARP